MVEGDEVRLVVVDDQASIREALAMMLDLMDGITVVGTGADGNEAVALVEEHRPDVVLMDLRMPRMDGIAATSVLAERFPETAVVVLTTFDDEESIIAALGAGARGYLTKQAGRADISRAVQAAAAGQAVLDPAVQARLVAAAVGAAAVGAAAAPAGPDAHRAVPPTEVLSAREREVLALIAGGRSNKEIATELYVTEATVKTHVNNIFAKAGLRDRAQAVHYAFTRGLV
ncbi:DNA-binding response regulator [Nakamurella silvestris]|nr:DNA-binding response regulator [Nakamurella silvestris]